MEKQGEYFKGYFTTVDKDRYKWTCQSFKAPVTEKFKWKTVGCKKKGLKSERRDLRYLRDEIEKELFEKPLVIVKVVETFGDLVDVWIKIWVPMVRETTVNSQSKLLEKYVYPFFRDLSLKVLKPMLVEEIWADILSYKGERSKRYLEKTTLEKVRSLFKQIPYYAYRNDLLNFDPQKS